MRKIITKIEVLNESEIELIHTSALQILERVGLKVPNAECLELCEKAGANVDKQKEIVRIPKTIMEEVLQHIKKSVKTSQYNEVAKMKGNISTQVFVVDYKTGHRRYGTMDDVLKGIVLTDSLKNIKDSSAVTVPHDVPENLSDILSYQTIFTFSKRPGNTYILSPRSGEYIIEMSKIMNRTTGYFLETISPLSFRVESLEMALVFAKQKQPISIGPMVVGGATGPITIAGIITLQNAEILASIFIAFVLNSLCGFYGSYNHTMDLRTTTCSFGSPNQALLGMAAAQMGRFYGFSVASNSGLTDSIIPDFQAGFEKTLSAVMSSMTGCNNFGAQGIVGADQGISLEQLVLDNEWIDAYNYVLGGFEVNEETIGLSVIEQVGTGGNFLSEDHTVEHMHANYWPSNLFHRSMWDSFKERGAKNCIDMACDYVESVTKNYKQTMPVIDSSTKDKIDYIVKCAKEELDLA